MRHRERRPAGQTLLMEKPLAGKSPLLALFPVTALAALLALVVFAEVRAHNLQALLVSTLRHDVSPYDFSS